MRNEATQRLKPPKVTTLAELARGTARRERLRTVAEGCEQLQTVADGCERLRHVYRIHPQHPDPQSDTGTLATHTGTLATHTGTRYFAKPRIARDAKEDSAIVFFARLKAASSV